MTLNDLTTYVRQLTGVFSTDVVADSLIARWINEAYNELAQMRDWDWLETSYTGAVPAFTGGKHTVNLANGTRRIIRAYLRDSNGSVVEMEQTDTLAPVEVRTQGVKYDVTFAGVFTFAPEQPTSSTVTVEYSRTNVELASGTDSPVFASAFHGMLAYRAAMKMLAFMADDTPRSQFYAGEYATMLDGMISMYELDHDYRTFQMGGDGQITRNYFPWFKPL